MTAHPDAPMPADGDHPVDDARDDRRRVVPVADGVVPSPDGIDALDWSGDARAAAVGRLLDSARRLDAAAADLVADLVRVVHTGATEAVLGAAVEVVLSQSCRLPGFERSTLLRCAHVLGRMPATMHRFRTGRMSWAQARAVVAAARRLPSADLAWCDDVAAGLVDELSDCEGDWLVWELDQRIDALLADRQGPDRRRVHTANRLGLQPGLDGSGRGWFEYDADHFPLLVTALDAHATAADGALHDGLERSIDPTRAAGADTTPRNDRALTDAAIHAARLTEHNARRRGASLFELVTGWRTDTLEPAPIGGSGATTRPSVLVTCTLDDLLGPDAATTHHGHDRPSTSGRAWWLGRLAGRIRVTSDVVRRWVAVHGADVRTVVLDDVGEVVGVGRRRRLAPDWLRDAVVARDLHCTGPASTTAATHCDVDHVHPWELGGRTEVDNLTLLARRWHTRKTDGHWQVQRHADGSRTWTNAGTGYRVWQPPRRHHTPPRPRGP